MSSQPDVPQHVLDYLAESKAVTLATTSGQGDPHAATLLYANDGLDLFIWLKGHSVTAANLEQNARAGFAIDEYSDDWSRTKGIQGTGECSPVTGDDIARVAILFGDKFPQLEPGGSTASIRFFRIRPQELKFIDNTGAESGGGDEFGFNYKREQVLG